MAKRFTSNGKDIEIKDNGDVYVDGVKQTGTTDDSGGITVTGGDVTFGTRRESTTRTNDFR